MPADRIFTKKNVTKALNIKHHQRKFPLERSPGRLGLEGGNREIIGGTARQRQRVKKAGDVAGGIIASGTGKVNFRKVSTPSLVSAVAQLKRSPKSAARTKRLNIVEAQLGKRSLPHLTDLNPPRKARSFR